VHQQGQYIIPTFEGGHVILKFSVIDPASPISHHLKDGIFQAVKIHIHVNFQSFIRFRTSFSSDKTVFCR